MKERDETRRAAGDEQRREAERAPTPADGSASGSVSRRTALKVLAAGAAGAAALPALSCADGDTPAGGEAAGPAETPGSRSVAAGTLTDPDLISPSVPWDPLLTDEEMRTVTALCDVIIPTDDRSPSASEVGAHHFINEWVSAPYDGNRRDLVLVRGGILWLNVESVERFGSEFAGLTDDRKRAICDDIAYEPEAAAEYRAGARFFDKIRDLTSTAFWTTDEGMADLGYIGNVPLDRFDGPPPEVLERLGLG